MSHRLKVGVAGGGLIAQVEHIPNLLALHRKFELVAVSDPSAKVRAGLAERFGVRTVARAEELLGLGLEALVIAAPDPWHGALAEAALEAGLHVFCEKPLCYGVAEIEALIAARDARGKVLQVGYMKRFDPSYEAARALVAGRAASLRLVSVEVSDPDAAPFVAHHPLVAGGDVDPGLIRATAERRAAQIEAALGFAPDPLVARGFAGAYCSALVHDVNIVHGLLTDIDMNVGPLVGAAIFAGGVGGHASVALGDGRALWTMTHLEVPVADYRERVTLAFDELIVELSFPSPYLNHHPTGLTVRRSDGHRLETTAFRASYEEAFVRELEAFWATVVEGAPPRNTAEDARRDQALLVAMARRAAGVG